MKIKQLSSRLIILYFSNFKNGLIYENFTDFCVRIINNKS